jgi:hypothetical protein
MHRSGIVAFASLLLVAGVALGHDQNADARKAGTSVDAGNGKMITVSYVPRHWSEDMWKRLQSDEKTRQGFNMRALPSFASLSTPVDLKIGDATVPAGEYAMAGFQVNEKGEWFWIVRGSDGKDLSKIALPTKDSPETAAHLMLTLLPGDSSNAFTLTYRYGNKLATVGFTTAEGGKKETKPADKD